MIQPVNRFIPSTPLAEGFAPDKKSGTPVAPACRPVTSCCGGTCAGASECDAPAVDVAGVGAGAVAGAQVPSAVQGFARQVQRVCRVDVVGAAAAAVAEVVDRPVRCQQVDDKVAAVGV